MPAVDAQALTALADALIEAYARPQFLPAPPSSSVPGFDLTSAYAVEAELTARRRASGRTTVGRKVGYANKAVWRALKLDTLVWAHMYDDTVRFADDNAASLPLGRMVSPKIEPEIVFKLGTPIRSTDGPLESVAVLEHVEWLALGFEIIDTVYADWKFQPSDFVAAYGLHAALVVGDPKPIGPDLIPGLVENLARFKVVLLKDGQVVQEGSGRNSLRSPALCLGELAAAIARQPGAEPLAAGEYISSGTLTESTAIAPGERWTAHVEGLDLPDLTLQTTTT
jgi:2-oxo-3-hexenedioate decarboxylase